MQNGIQWKFRCIFEDFKPRVYGEGNRFGLANAQSCSAEQLQLKISWKFVKIFRIWSEKMPRFSFRRNLSQRQATNVEDRKMPIGRRGLIVPQNTFLEDVIRRSDSLHESFMVGSAEISDYPVVYCSNGFSEITGFKRSEVMRYSCDGRFLHRSTVKKDVTDSIDDALRTKTSCQVEFIGNKKNGTPVWYLLHVAPIENEENVVVLFLVTVRDISEFKEPIAENDAAQKWVKLKQTIKTKDRSGFVVAFSKTKEEKNKIRIAQFRVQNADFIPQYKQQIPKPPKWVMLHYSFYRVVWDWLVLLFILYTASAVPFAFCFSYDSVPMTVVDILVDVFFFVDIALNFHTSYVGEDGEVITDLKQIRHYYLKTWFILDLVTSLPYGLLSFVSTDSVFVNLISFFKCIRFLRVGRVFRKLDQFINYGFMTLILCLVAFLLCAHLMACIFYLIAHRYDNFHEVGWVATLARQTNQPFNTTVADDPLLPTLPSRYVSALYYCLTSLTTIGFGNIAPNTTAEKIFGSIFMIVGALGYAVIFGQVTAIVQQAQKQSEKYHSLLDNIRSFQKLYRVPEELSARILDYFMSTWALTKGVDTDEVLKQCPKDLQSDLCIHLNRKVLYNNPAFSSMPMGVMRTIARNFCICHVAALDRVVHEGEGLDVLYFISHGSFEVKQDGQVVGLLGQDDVFGDDVCNEVTVGKSIADVYALTYSDIHCIDRNDLRDVLMSYPESGVQFSTNLKLTFNLRHQVNRQKASSVQPTQDAYTTENNQTSLPTRGTRFMNPAAAGHGRRLSLVQELNQTIDMESWVNGDVNTSNDTSGGLGRVRARKRPGRVSTTVISEEDEEERREEELPLETEPELNVDPGTEEANMGFYPNQFHENQHSSEVAGLQDKLNEVVSELNAKLTRVENQLALVIRLVQSKKTKPELQARASFPTSTTSSNASDTPENVASPSWLYPTLVQKQSPVSDSSNRSVSSKLSRDGNEDTASPAVNIARHGRRKINEG
ncbi:LOW QUALITY PROTEIN: potassium voltage-gated channel subfamily H member 1-like [Dendronephthya gigantea]|uniref:LOW QUALITY PROTEIN: potassium voltage-gated channel subfamily H member 1-like n=1 Tax=Dendronephthya gigantea TaxID=151771 RepID=UPI00106A18C0|nr:LOW QUALITY PROTEIN: potassium voltage-gated channel subfamily H member 1-like [Dendronephthya gigantea]